MTPVHPTSKRILFICGSMNQTTQMHKIALQLPEYQHAFTPYYATGLLDAAQRIGLLENTILGQKLGSRAIRYLVEHRLTLDHHGRNGPYDLVVTCSDLIIPGNVRGPLVLVQEGMTDPEPWFFPLIQRIPLLPRWLASTASTGLSHRYDAFCVASEGYRELFLRKGVRDERIVVTGIPNFDDLRKHLVNTFPHRHHVLVCTSDTRETWGREDRRATIRKALELAAGRTVIFKLHPNEDAARATEEIARYAPGALVYAHGPTEEMIANCDVLITRFSTTAYVGIALGKEVHSEFSIPELRTLMPLQNGNAAANIAAVCRRVIEGTSGGSGAWTGHGRRRGRRPRGTRSRMPITLPEWLIP